MKDFPDTGVVVASHPRSGTHLLIDVLRRQFRECRSWKWPGERLDRLYCNIDELGGEEGILDVAVARRILRRTERPIVKTHAWPGYDRTFLPSHHDGLSPRWHRWLEEGGTELYIYRDGRDVLCSYQLFLQKIDERAHCSIGTFLRQHREEQSRVQRWASHVRGWRDASGVHTVCFERLLTRPAAVIRELGAVLGLDPTWTEPLLPDPFASIWESRWARLVKMGPESTAIINEKSQAWKEGFTSDDRQFFHNEAGDLLIELGYEKSGSWV